MPDPARLLADRLTAAGLNSKEARVLAHLAVTGPARASDVARRAGVRRTDIYRMLGELMRRGFVTSHLRKPALFEAASLGRVFDDLAAGHRARADQIEHARAEVEEALGALEAVGLRRAPGGFRILHGRAAAWGALEGMIHQADEALVLLEPHRGWLQAAEANRFWALLTARAREGISVRLLLPRESVALLAPEDLPPAMRVAPWLGEPAGSLALRDRREVLLGLAAAQPWEDPAADEMQLWTDAPAVAQLVSQLLDLAWQRGPEESRPGSRRGLPEA